MTIATLNPIAFLKAPSSSGCAGFGNIATRFSGSSRRDPYISALSPAAWYRYGVGITTATGVSSWADQSGNGRNLVQAVGGNQPALQADNSILFDGTAHYLQVTFALNQPVTNYLLFKQVSWTNVDVALDGSAATAGLVQANSSPNLAMNAGSQGGGLTVLAVGAYGVDCQVYNGASSIHQQNTTTSGTFNAGANNPGGITLGANVALTNFANIQVKELIVFADAHSSLTRHGVMRYLLGKVGGINV